MRESSSSRSCSGSHDLALEQLPPIASGPVTILELLQEQIQQAQAEEHDSLTASAIPASPTSKVEQTTRTCTHASFIMLMPKAVKLVADLVRHMALAASVRKLGQLGDATVKSTDIDLIVRKAKSEIVRKAIKPLEDWNHDAIHGLSSIVHEMSCALDTRVKELALKSNIPRGARMLMEEELQQWANCFQDVWDAKAELAQELAHARCADNALQEARKQVQGFE